MSKGDGEGGSAYPKSVQAGIPKLSNPAGWPVVRIGDIFKVVQRRVDLQDDAKYQLVTAKRNRGGVVPRERLNGKDILTKSQFRIATGDFLISRRQIAHGACGIVPEELAGAIVSNEYATLLPTDLLDPGFMRHLPESIYFQQTCFHSSIGVHVEKLVFNLEDWLNWSISIPSRQEQERVAYALDTWNEAIVSAENLLELKTKAAHADFERLLFNLPTISLSKLATVKMGQSPPSSSYREAGSPNSLPLAGGAGDFGNHGFVECTSWTDKPQKVVRGGAVIMSVRAPVGSYVLSDGDLALGRGVCALIPRGFDNTELLGLLVSRLESYWHRIKQGGTFEAVNSDDIREAPVPDIRGEYSAPLGKLVEAQNSILRTEAARVHLLRRQKRGLMQKLLTGEWQVPESIDRLMPGGDAAATLPREASAA